MGVPVGHLFCSPPALLKESDWMSVAVNMMCKWIVPNAGDMGVKLPEEVEV